MRLGDLDALQRSFIDNDVDDFGLIANAPTVEAYPFEQVQELVALNQQFAKEIEEQKRPQGKKIKKKQYGWVYCSECDSLLEQQDNFCWNCGADMRGGAE